MAKTSYFFILYDRVLISAKLRLKKHFIFFVLCRYPHIKRYDIDYTADQQAYRNQLHNRDKGTVVRRTLLKLIIRRKLHNEQTQIQPRIDLLKNIGMFTLFPCCLQNKCRKEDQGIQNTVDHQINPGILRNSFVKCGENRINHIPEIFADSAESKRKEEKCAFLLWLEQEIRNKQNERCKDIVSVVIRILGRFCKNFRNGQQRRQKGRKNSKGNYALSSLVSENLSQKDKDT